jgi:hypothetical protein
MGAYDAIGASTFKVELDEWYVELSRRIFEVDHTPYSCKILRDATPKSFVILDGELDDLHLQPMYSLSKQSWGGGRRLMWVNWFLLSYTQLTAL